MKRFEVHYVERSGGPVEKLPRMTREEFLEWVQTEGVKLWFFDVFQFEYPDE